MEWVGMPPSSQPEVSSPGGFGAVRSPVLLLVVTFKGVKREGRESGLAGNIGMALNR